MYAVSFVQPSPMVAKVQELCDAFNSRDLVKNGNGLCTNGGVEIPKDVAFDP